MLTRKETLKDEVERLQVFCAHIERDAPFRDKVWYASRSFACMERITALIEETVSIDSMKPAAHDRLTGKI